MRNYWICDVCINCCRNANYRDHDLILEIWVDCGQVFVDTIVDFCIVVVFRCGELIGFSWMRSSGKLVLLGLNFIVEFHWISRSDALLGDTRSTKLISEFIWNSGMEFSVMLMFSPETVGFPSIASRSRCCMLDESWWSRYALKKISNPTVFLYICTMLTTKMTKKKSLVLVQIIFFFYLLTR